MEQITRNIAVGYEFQMVPIRFSRDTEFTYIDMTTSTCTGSVRLAPPNIHSDIEFAKNEGLPGMVYDGLLTTARLEAIMRDIFGTAYFNSGRITTKFIKPLVIDKDDEFTIRLVVKSKIEELGGVRVVLEINCFKQNGELVTVGEASAVVH